MTVNTRLLFVCTGNIARSQIAEGLARAMAVAGVEVARAGSRPNPKGIHPLAVQDPVIAGESPAEQLAFFRDIRDDLERRLRVFLAERSLLRGAA